CLIAVLMLAASMVGQETTGGVQGTVKDAADAVVAKASVSLTGTTLIGTKTTETDAKGYYRFANLPPGAYKMTVNFQGFASVKRQFTVEVGHLPNIDVTMEVGTTSTVVEVTGEAPIIDVTTTHTMTNITQDVIQDVPHGRSFQSVIQFAPSARNEPLEG